MENNGWIKLHRKFLKWEWLDKPKMVSLFIHLLLLANHETGKWHGQEIKRGQLITGRKKLSKLTGIKQGSIRECIKTLKSTNEITTNSTNKYTIITIVKYSDYQDDERKPTNKTTNTFDNNQPTTNQQTATNNKNNKNKNNKETIADIKSALINKLSLKREYSGNKQWQDEAQNASVILNCPIEKKSALFKCFKDHQGTARNALSDCKELGKLDILYFFKVFSEINKKQI